MTNDFDYVITFPTQTDLADVPAEAIRGLGIDGGPILMCFYLAPIICIIFYPITKERYKEIRTALDNT